VSDILPIYAWFSSVRAWYFYLFMLDVYLSRAWCFICTCLIFLSVHAWCLSIMCLMFICTCLMFYLYMLDVLSVHAWCFYLFVLDGLIWPYLTFLSVCAWCLYPSVLDIFVRLYLMFLSNCVWFNPTIIDNLSLSKISFFVSTGLIFCQMFFKFSVLVLKNFFLFFLLAFFYKTIFVENFYFNIGKGFFW
jgi:hypothetical protein